MHQKTNRLKTPTIYFPREAANTVREYLGPAPELGVTPKQHTDLELFVQNCNKCSLQLGIDSGPNRRRNAKDRSQGSRASVRKPASWNKGMLLFFKWCPAAKSPFMTSSANTRAMPDSTRGIMERRETPRQKNNHYPLSRKCKHVPPTSEDNSLGPQGRSSKTLITTRSRECTNMFRVHVWTTLIQNGNAR